MRTFITKFLPIVILVAIAAIAAPSLNKYVKRAGKPVALGRQEVNMPKVIFLPPDTRQERFDAAVEAIAEGEKVEGIEEIQRLALLKPDFIPAHRYLIEQILSEGLHKRSRVKLFQLRQHLERVSENGDDEVTAVLAQHYIDANKHKRAIEVLRKLIDSRPATNAQLAQMLIDRDKQDEGFLIAENTVLRFKKTVEANPDDVEARLILADNLMVLGRMVDATDVLRERVKQLPELHDEMMEHALAAVDQALVDNESLAFDLMKRGISDDPTSLPMWTRVVTMSLSGSDMAEAANEFASSASQQRTSGGMPEFARGTMAYDRGEKKQAIAELEKAYALAPTNPQIIDHLATYLTMTFPPQLDRAYKLADKLIKANPKHQKYRGTRGQILTMLGRTDEAIEDLEAALEEVRGHRAFVTTLSFLYERQGDIVKAVALRADADPTHDDFDRSGKTIDLLHEVLQEFKAEKEVEAAKGRSVAESQS